MKNNSCFEKKNKLRLQLRNGGNMYGVLLLNILEWGGVIFYSLIIIGILFIAYMFHDSEMESTDVND